MAPVHAQEAAAPSEASASSVLDDTPQKLRITGFGTLGITHDKSPAGWGYRRDQSQDGSGPAWRADVDSRLGVQFDYQLDPQWNFVTQLIGMRRPSNAPLGDVVEWAYAAWRPDPAVSLRAGRLNIESFLMADYRNVGFGYLTVRPPIEFYGILPTSLNGADASHTWIVDGVQWRLKAFGGIGEYGDLKARQRTVVKPVYGLMLQRNSESLQALLGVTRVSLRTLGTRDTEAALAELAALGEVPVPEVAAEATRLHDQLDLARSEAVFLTLGLRYEHDDWQWSAEFAHMVGPAVLREQGRYFVLGRRFGQVVVFIGASAERPGAQALATPAWTSALTPAIGAEAAAQAQALGAALVHGANAARVHQATHSLGLRWDFHPQAALKLQLDRTRTSANGSALWEAGTPQSGHAKVFSVALDFLF